MAKLAAVAVCVLFASCLSTGQVHAPNAPLQAGPPIGNAPSQTGNDTGEIPTFQSQARQVLVTVAVWKDAARSAAWVPKEALKRYPGAADVFATPPVARGLSANDFRVFDNGVGQKINYLEESDFAWRDINQQWIFIPDIRGTWGHYASGDLGLAAPTATYVIGYIPPPSQSGDCHTVQVVAGNNDVLVNRTRYCDTDEGGTATVEGRKLAAQMEKFAQSGKSGSIKVSSQPFVLWSSRVLSLIRDDNPAGIGSASASAAANYTYVVVVHDSRAPASVEIATEYELETKKWDYPCPRHAAIYVIGGVYKLNGEVAARFGDSCLLLGGRKLFRRSIVFPVFLCVFVILGPFARTLFAHGNEIAEDYSYLGGMEGISLGCLTALVLSSRRFSRRAIWVLGIAGTLVVSASLIFSWQAYRGWLGKTGLNFTLLGVGTCMFIAATTQTEWRSPRVLGPLVRMGRYSYEIYLTHMFVVFTFFDLLLRAGKPLRGVPVLFASAILVAGLLGASVANLYSEPANRFLRSKSRNPVGSGASIALTPAQEATITSFRS